MNQIPNIELKYCSLFLVYFGFFIFEISNLYDFGLGFISSLTNLFGIKGFVIVVIVLFLFILCVCICF
jgi:hypothetical protein